MSISRKRKGQALALGILGFGAGLIAAGTSAASDGHGQVGPLIIGGTEVPRGKYPFMASVQIDGKHRCGGSLLSSTLVITAAHCVEGVNDKNAHRLSVTVGQTLLSDGIGSQRRGIRAIDVSTLDDSDLALVTLDAPVEGIVPVTLPTAGADALYRPGQMATVIGWGNTDSQSFPYYPDRLREVDVPIVSMDECAISYSDHDMSTYFCAGVRGKDSCQGDSGGPIIRAIGARVYQIGVVSFGDGCADQGAPGAYVNLSLPSLLDSLDRVWEKPADQQTGAVARR